MTYITGIHALNLPCNLDTCGDWHTSAIQWEKPQTRESNNMFFGEYGIESGHDIPNHKGTYYVANTIRACLDLLQEGTFTVAQGMNDDFICNEKYDEEVFEKVLEMKTLENWNEIDSFMKREYRVKWLNYKEKYSE